MKNRLTAEWAKRWELFQAIAQAITPAPALSPSRAPEPLETIAERFYPEEFAPSRADINARVARRLYEQARAA